MLNIFWCWGSKSFDPHSIKAAVVHFVQCILDRAFQRFFIKTFSLPCSMRTFHWIINSTGSANGLKIPHVFQSISSLVTKKNTNYTLHERIRMHPPVPAELFNKSQRVLWRISPVHSGQSRFQVDLDMNCSKTALSWWLFRIVGMHKHYMPWYQVMSNLSFQRPGPVFHMFNQSNLDSCCRPESKYPWYQ